MKSAGSTPPQAAGLSSTRRLFPPRSLLASFSRGKRQIAVCGPMCKERCHGEERWDRAFTPRWASGAAKGRVLPTGSSSATLGREAQAGRWGLSAALRPAAAPRPPKSRGEAASCTPSTPRWSSKQRRARAVPPLGAGAVRCRCAQPCWVRLPLPLPFPPPRDSAPLPPPRRPPEISAARSWPRSTAAHTAVHSRTDFPPRVLLGQKTQGWDGGWGRAPEAPVVRPAMSITVQSITVMVEAAPAAPPPLLPSSAGRAQSTERPHTASPRLTVEE